ncbi:hypothetical protein GJI79_04300 [Lactococcus lactis subsp. cremoris]|uniref:hypothetical protein n=1 Tax=Lactococcus TaxID=1357 RepID=UPI0009BDB023|nr:hypothetical protein [Lactococcus cremoris]ARD90197.1 hypothetical protein LL158_04105 [Lactococcus cremoris]MRM68235.1 hypothetical protein [Lactococcus cremoris]QRZ31041.1 hypothetical protein LLB26_pB20 [Lactococcus cremoris]
MSNYLVVVHNVQKAKQKTLSEELSMTMEVVVNPLTFVNEKVSGLGETALEFAKQISEGVAVGIAVVIIVGITTVSAPADAIGLAAAFIFTLITKSITG